MPRKAMGQRLNIRVPVALKDFAEKYADTNETTLSDIVREHLEELQKQEKKTNESASSNTKNRSPNS